MEILKINLNLRIVNLLVLGNVKCEINVYDCIFIMIVGDTLLSTS
jgi:hypothetical protein